jgi:hypothetical protein
VIAVLAVTAGFSLLQNREYGRVMGYLFAILAIVEGFMLLFYAPWYGAFAILLGFLVIYGLAAAGEPWEGS